MKLLRRSVLIILALLLASVLFAVTASADLVLEYTPEATEAPKVEETADPGDTTTTGADDTTTTGADDTTTVGAADSSASSTRMVYPVPYDSEGNIMGASLLGSCLGSANAFYIKKDYRFVVSYYDSSTGNITETSTPLLVEVVCDSEHQQYIRTEGNTIYLSGSPTPFNFTIRVADPFTENSQADHNVSVIRFNFSFLELVIAGLGVYLIINAVKGKSNTFSDEYIKDEKKPLFKRIALCCGIGAGIALIASAVLSVCFSYLSWTTIARYVLLGIAIVLLLGVSIANSIFTDREKRDKADREKMGGGGAPSASAFEFDGTEPTIDDVLADIENGKNAEPPKDEL